MEYIKSTGKRSTNLVGKCGSCKFYIPHAIKTWKLETDTMILEACRGSCMLKNKARYKQRTDTCKRFVKAVS